MKYKIGDYVVIRGYDNINYEEHWLNYNISVRPLNQRAEITKIKPGTIGTITTIRQTTNPEPEPPIYLIKYPDKQEIPVKEKELRKPTPKEIQLYQQSLIEEQI